jgi:multiple sugar transport system substrate-binding protein
MEVKGATSTHRLVDGVKHMSTCSSLVLQDPPLGLRRGQHRHQQGQVAMAMQWFYFSVRTPIQGQQIRWTKSALDAAGRYRPRQEIPPPVLGRWPGHGHQQVLKKLPELTKFMEWYFQPEQQKRYAAVCRDRL